MFMLQWEPDNTSHVTLIFQAKSGEWLKQAVQERCSAIGVNTSGYWRTFELAGYKLMQVNYGRNFDIYGVGQARRDVFEALFRNPLP